MEAENKILCKALRDDRARNRNLKGAEDRGSWWGFHSEGLVVFEEVFLGGEVPAGEEEVECWDVFFDYIFGEDLDLAVWEGGSQLPRLIKISILTSCLVFLKPAFSLIRSSNVLREYFQYSMVSVQVQMLAKIKCSVYFDAALSL